jgi:uncharacterized protein YggE
VLSVRGEARQIVAPDYAIVFCAMEAIESSKAQALQVLSARMGTVVAELSALGGVVRTPDTDRAPLTFSSGSASSYAEEDHDPRSGKSHPTGRVITRVDLRITARAFDVLDRLFGVLGRHESLTMHSVSWGVDADNRAWPQVRATAIQAALAKGRDYATALGGSLSSVEHIADSGLLGGASDLNVGGGARFAMTASGGGGAPSLDPVPQELVATIEARLRASVPPLS